MEPYYPLILLTFFGFCTLAFALLAPVYFFLDREEKASKNWTEEALATHLKAEAERRASNDGGSASL